MKETFMELSSVEEANRVPLDDYTFLERLSAAKGKYCFKIRESKRV